MLLHALTGSVGTPGGVSPNGWNKFVPKPFAAPPPQPRWNELLYPPEWPLSHHELSELLPHLLKEGRGKLDTYFTRVFNPVWTYPDGFSWVEVLRDEKLVGLHAALTPVWSETAWYADYILPMGMSPERHDLMSQETHAAKWIGFRQPVLRVFQEKRGKPVEFTYQANPGEVWEEDEFWINLSWAIDPDGSLGVRQWFESPYRPGQRITVDEYYQYIFENSVPGLPAAAAQEGLTPLAYMRKYACFEVARDVYRVSETPLPQSGGQRQPGTRRPAGARGQAGRRPRRGQQRGWLQHAFSQTGAVFAHDGRLEVARAGPARLHRQPRRARRPEGGRGRKAGGHVRSGRHSGGGLAAARAGRSLLPAADLPLAHADPHPHQQRQVAVRAVPPESALDRDPGRKAAGRGHRRSGQGTHGNRLLRAPRVGHGRAEARCPGLLESPGPLANAGAGGDRTLQQCLGRPPRGGAGPLAVTPTPRRDPATIRRPRYPSASGGAAPASIKT